MSNQINERVEDLTGMLIRFRVQVDDPEGQTALDIQTHLRALAGIVTVRQTRGLSKHVTPSKKRLMECHISYVKSRLDSYAKIDDLLVLFKRVEGIDMVKLMEHDDPSINASLIKNGPITV